MLSVAQEVGNGRRSPHDRADGRACRCEGCLARTGLRARADRASRGADRSVHPCAERSAQTSREVLTGEWVRWVESFGPVLQIHVPPQFPWFRPETQVRAAALMQKLIAEASGEVPTMFCAIQRNVKRGFGCHSHDLACGSAQLLQGRRTAIWSEFRQVVGGWPGVGQPGYWGLRPVSAKGSALLIPLDIPRDRPSSRSAHVGERDWGFVSPVRNDCRLRLLPIQGHGTQLVTYCVRYCMREDVEQSVEVLPVVGAAETWARYGV